MSDNIIQVDIIDQMKENYIDYSMSVIVGRALPDVRDGLKPVHRRILYAMNELGMTYSKPHKKSARLVGEVLGKYHPHGDTSVYDAMVRFAQSWNMRYTLIDGQGNFGSPDDKPAAMRYTEARMNKLSDYSLLDLKYDTVDYINNFDDSLQEPSVLPSRIPQLLVNGASGIAVGMATSMLPHNLSEVIDGCVEFVKNPDITLTELMKYIKAPDFPTGGSIISMNDIIKGYKTGRGKVVVRGKAHIEEVKGRPRIVIYEIPYQTTPDTITEKISGLVNSKTIVGITNISDQTNKDGIRIVLDLKKDINANIILNQLYKYTSLQSSYSINNVALVNGRPKVLSLIDIIKEFIHFRYEIITKRTQYLLNKANERAHILEGYLKVISTRDTLDLAISIIRNSANADVAKISLIEAFQLDDEQAKSILELKLRTLTGLEIEKISSELEELKTKISEYTSILSSKERINQIIIDELLEIKDKFSDKRRTTIEIINEDIQIEELIDEEEVIITISDNNYIKRIPSSQYKTQKRGGKGSKTTKVQDEEIISKTISASTHDILLIITNNGKLYRLKTHEIPEASKNSRGRAIQNLLSIENDDKIAAITQIKSIKDLDYLDNHYLFLATKQGIVKKVKLTDVSKMRSNGSTIITIKDNDELLHAKITNGNSIIVLGTLKGNAISFYEEDVRPTGKTAIGVTGANIDNNDHIISLISLSTSFNDLNKDLLVISENGIGKRTSFFKIYDNEDLSKLSEAEMGNLHKVNDYEGNKIYFTPNYRITNRGSKGVKTLKINEKTGNLISMSLVDNDSDVLVVSEKGVAIRLDVSTIRDLSRNTSGAKIINIADNDKVSSVSILEKEEITYDESDIIDSIIE